MQFLAFLVSKSLRSVKREEKGITAPKNDNDYGDGNVKIMILLCKQSCTYNFSEIGRCNCTQQKKDNDGDNVKILMQYCKQSCIQSFSEIGCWEVHLHPTRK